MIGSVQADIEARLGGTVYSVDQRLIEYEPLSPYRQRVEVSFALGNYDNSSRSRRSSDIMSSPSLLSEYSDKIIRGCAEVVRVSFGMIATDWIRRYSWINNQVTRRDECLEPRRDIERVLRWGQQICL